MGDKMELAHRGGAGVRNSEQDKHVNIRLIALGAVVSFVVTIISAVVITAMVSAGKISEWNGSYVYVLIAVNTLIGSVVAGWKSSEKIAVIVGSTSGAYSLILIAVSILVFDGLGGKTLFCLLSVMVGAVVSCAICIRKGSGKKKRKRASV